MLSENATPPEQTRAYLKRALPPNEWNAVNLWLGTFYPFQLRWLLDWSLFSLYNKSRQIGCSHTAGAAKSVLRGLLGDTSTVISKGQREAEEVIDKAELHCRALVAFGSQWAQKPKGADRHKSGENVRMASGGRIIALPSTSGARSFTGHAVCDELGYMQDAEAVLEAAGGSALLGFSLSAMSTPNGVGNTFHQLWSDVTAHAGYSRHEVTIDDAIADGYPVDLEKCWKLARGNPRVFDQMFRCKFLDGADQYIPSALIDGTIVENAYCDEGLFFAGLDIGKTADITALVIVVRDKNGFFWVQKVVECKRTSYDDLQRIVDEAFRDYPISRMCVDSTGLGIFPVEAMQKKHSRFKVEAVNFSLKSKEDMATTLYSVIQDRKLYMQREESPLREDIAMLRRIVTSSNQVRYDAPRTDKGHADRAWALALALHAGTGPDRRKHELRTDS